MEWVYGAISTSFFVLLLIGTLIYRAHYRSRKKTLSGGALDATRRSEDHDRDAEAFLTEIGNLDDDE